MDNHPVNPTPSLTDFLVTLFSSLSQDKQFDPGVVHLVFLHLGQESIHTQAGKRLAKSIVELAKERSKGETK